MEPATTDLTVSLVEHTSFAVSDRAGDILPGTYHGFFVADTRFLSRFVLRLDGKRLEPLASGGEHHGAGTFYLANPRLSGVPPSTISVFRDRVLAGHLAERIRLISYNLKPIDVELTLELDSDFADIFEVRGRSRMRRSVTTQHRPRRVDFAYDHQGYLRRTTVALDRSVSPTDGRLALRARLRHGRPWDLNVRIEPSIAHARGVVPVTPRRRIDPGRVTEWRASLPQLRTTDGRLTRAWHRAVRDMASLLLTAPAGRFIPAAGLPWFLAIFGRDASITAMQSLLLGPDIAFGTLRQLAEFQGTVADPWLEEEPGKIPHEVRTGELATLKRIPFGRYYGSIDATPLYLMLFAAVCRWSGWLRPGPADGTRRRTPGLVTQLLPHAEAALRWIDGRADDDGLVWYGPARRGGIRNQAWKDSHDSMRYADGRIADVPIAPVEVQGYVVRARRGMAQVYAALGRDADAARERAAADAVALAIEERFWMPDEGTYALGLDPDGRRIDGVGSNAGHLLWADVVSPKRVDAVVERLMAPDMFTGWGIRTLSNRNPGYNPVGYHTGSVWPHDTSLVAAGMARAGRFTAAQAVFDALLDAADANPSARLPELFAGFDRASTPDLVPYPTACAPQAWATGAIFVAVRTIAGIAEAKRLPQWRSLEVDPVGRNAWSRADLASAND